MNNIFDRLNEFKLCKFLSVSQPRVESTFVDSSEALNPSKSVYHHLSKQIKLKEYCLLTR